MGVTPELLSIPPVLLLEQRRLCWAVLGGGWGGAGRARVLLAPSALLGGVPRTGTVLESSCLWMATLSQQKCILCKDSQEFRGVEAAASLNR